MATFRLCKNETDPQASVLENTIPTESGFVEQTPAQIHSSAYNNIYIAKPAKNDALLNDIYNCLNLTDFYIHGSCLLRDRSRKLLKFSNFNM